MHSLPILKIKHSNELMTPGVSGKHPILLEVGSYIHGKIQGL